MVLSWLRIDKAGIVVLCILWLLLLERRVRERLGVRLLKAGVKAWGWIMCELHAIRV